jgi:hypothetical protein
MFRGRKRTNAFVLGVRFKLLEKRFSWIFYQIKSEYSSLRMCALSKNLHIDEMKARKLGGETHKYHYELYIIILMYIIVLRYRPTMCTGYADAPTPPGTRLSLRPTKPTTNALLFLALTHPIPLRSDSRPLTRRYKYALGRDLATHPPSGFCP